MATTSTQREAPTSQAEAAEIMRRAGEAGSRMRAVGGATKIAWGAPTPRPEIEIATSGLRRVVEYNEGDLTVIVEPGMPLAQAQAEFERNGQMLALDPPLGEDKAATIGGVIATGDSGPLRHRYNAARDLIIGIRVALSDGSVANAGGKVIKNVAGYDLAKLFTGSFGTLGLIVEVSLRLHPRPEHTATLVGATNDPPKLARAAVEIAHARIELTSLDVGWEGGEGRLLARFGGAAAGELATEVRERIEQTGLDVSLEEDDAGVWGDQRLGQRSENGTVVKVSALQGDLPRVLAAAERQRAALVGRVTAGLWWLKLEGRSASDAAAAVEEIRRELAPLSGVVLDAPLELREAVDPWGVEADGRLELMRRVKQRFDPPGICNRGVFVGGI